MKIKFIIIILVFLACKYAGAQEISEWRMDNRTGVSSEKGLLKSWPAEGPELLWTYTELGKGYSSPSFSSTSIFITGKKEADDILYCLDMDGKLRWEKPMGRAWNASFPESRATPTVEADRVYTCSGYGDLACFDTEDGREIWSYRASEENKGTFGRWGISESLILDGDKLYFSPGGPETMTIAVDKATGKVIWRSRSLDDQPTYVSPVLVNYAGMKMIINTSMKYIYGVDASSGEIVWTLPQKLPEDFNPDWEVIKCVSPLFKDGKVYITGGYDIGAMMIEIAPDGKSAKMLWYDDVLDVHHGGVVLVDGYIYGSNWLNNGNGNWCCIDWESGEKMWEEHWNCKGSIISAEGLLYIYDEKKGFTGLVKATPEKFDLISSFRETAGNNGPYWAHPVIYNGILYLRHTNALVAYNIKGN